jgi:hypothetical protein
MTTEPAERLTDTTVKEWYLGQAAGLWVIFAILAGGAIASALIVVEKREPGYLLLVVALPLAAWLVAYVARHFAALVTMDDQGFSAVTLDFRRKGWRWAETRAEHSEYADGPIVLLRQLSDERAHVDLRRTEGGYDKAMRFAIEHAAERVTFEAAVAESLRRTKR